jgi:hypothetical protein
MRCGRSWNWRSDTFHPRKGKARPQGFLREAETRDKWDPLSLFNHVAKALRAMVTGYLEVFGSVGKAG